jgi:biopolymer transport protein ExbB
MWILILERLIFYRTTMRKQMKDAFTRWEARVERRSWHAHQIRSGMICEIRMAANQGLPLIQTLVALCPLLGLLGTVTGMITVFQVMASAGTGNVRSMAAGVSMATVPTMAGMVGALSGVFLVTILTRTARRRISLLEDDLTMDH